jgi:hypothetical protein
VKALELVLADALERATLLRSEGHGPQAASIERVCAEVRESMASFLEILSESEAQLRSSWTVDRLRGRFPEWEARGLAMLDERGKRRYRAIVLPARAEEAAAKLAGLRGEQLRSANG